MTKFEMPEHMINKWAQGYVNQFLMLDRKNAVLFEAELLRTLHNAQEYASREAARRAWFILKRGA